MAEHIVEITGISGCLVAQWGTGWDELLIWKTAANRQRPKGIIPPAAFPVHEIECLRQSVEREEILEVTLDQACLQERERAFLTSHHIHRMLIVPLVAHHDQIGMVALMESNPQRVINLHDRLVAQILIRQATTFLESTRLVENLMRYSNEMETIYQASLSLTASLELTTVLDELLRCTISLLTDASNAHIFLYRDGALRFGAARWKDGQQEQPLAEPRQNGLTYSVARSGEMIVVPDMSIHPLFERTVWVGAIVGLPLKIGSRVVGVMNVGFRQPHPIPETELRLLRLLGEQAAIAIENACLHEQLSQAARTDSLTELPNRRAFDERLLDEVRRARRYNHTFGLALIDLDQFKKINDTHGHATGDRALQAIASAMRKALRESDFVARYGGDEFAFILPEAGEPIARQIMSRVRDAIQDASSAMPEIPPNSFGASIGIAIYPLHGGSLTELVLAADKGLYDEKRNHFIRM
ncbi:MAG: sensor domain-containing diguanylate cyclase [Anaerolineae bacterium]|nr:sensor domain-containing diguanylate cyclase [Anaerolineae bacterium]